MRELEVTRRQDGATTIVRLRRRRGRCRAGARVSHEIDSLTLAESAAQSSVDVGTAVVASFTGDEVGASVEFQFAIGANRETRSRGCSYVALELGGWRSQDTSTATAISDSAVRVNAELCRGQTVIANPVLSIAQLTNRARSTARCSEVEAAGITTIDKGMGASGRSQESHETPHLDNERGKRNE